MLLNCNFIAFILFPHFLLCEADSRETFLEEIGSNGNTREAANSFITSLFSGLIKNQMKDYDLNGDNSLSEEEFQNMKSAFFKNSEKQHMYQLASFDKNGDGLLNSEEMDEMISNNFNDIVELLQEFYGDQENEGEELNHEPGNSKKQEESQDYKDEL